MIHIDLQPEPDDFDKQVRECGRKYYVKKGKTNKRCWSKCRRQLYDAYGGYCAYLAVKIPFSEEEARKAGNKTGFFTVDHFLPRSKYPGLAYEWSNYRSCCSIINNNKGDEEDILDPCTIGENWFVFDPWSGDIKANNSLQEDIKSRVENTINKLGLNEERFCKHRRYIWIFDNKTIEDESPFLFHEKQRLGDTFQPEEEEINKILGMF